MASAFDIQAIKDSEFRREVTFLANHNISLSDFILLTYFGAHETSVTATAEMVGHVISPLFKYPCFNRASVN